MISGQIIVNSQQMRQNQRRNSERGTGLQRRRGPKQRARHRIAAQRGAKASMVEPNARTASRRTSWEGYTPQCSSRNATKPKFVDVLSCPRNKPGKTALASSRHPPHLVRRIINASSTMCYAVELPSELPRRYLLNQPMCAAKWHPTNKFGLPRPQ